MLSLSSGSNSKKEGGTRFTMLSCGNTSTSGCSSLRVGSSNTCVGPAPGCAVGRCRSSNFDVMRAFANIRNEKRKM